MSQMKIVLTTIDNGYKANDIVEILLNERLAACINTRTIKSHYWWKDKIERDDEIQLIIKTKANLVDEVIKRIKDLHTYELPVIEVIDIEKTNEGVEEWLNKVTK